MSRAFVKEDGPDLDPLPDLPIGPHVNFVTPTGLQDLHDRRADRMTDLERLKARTDRLDRMPEKAAERDIRYLTTRLRTAVLIDVKTQNADQIGFGHRVTAQDDMGKTYVWQIVGEDEADASLGKITTQSPLARALTGAQIGDEIEWRKPGAPTVLTVIAFDPG